MIADDLISVETTNLVQKEIVLEDNEHIDSGSCSGHETLIMDNSVGEENPEANEWSSSPHRKEQCDDAEHILVNANNDDDQKILTTSKIEEAAISPSKEENTETNETSAIQEENPGQHETTVSREENTELTETPTSREETPDQPANPMIGENNTDLTETHVSQEETADQPATPVNQEENADKSPTPVSLEETAGQPATPVNQEENADKSSTPGSQEETADQPTTLTSQEDGLNKSVHVSQEETDQPATPVSQIEVIVTSPRMETGDVKSDIQWTGWDPRARSRIQNTPKGWVLIPV
jgi:hypothetical protein